MLFLRSHQPAEPPLSLPRRVLGATTRRLPASLQKRLILRAREIGLICDTDTESLIAERGLKEA
ncbi:hypothetical protein GAY31_19535 [Azospirillum brasilense]|nr:hypothetical protein [Azospirillum brasilense]